MVTEPALRCGALDTARFIQLIGEPGTGKSVLLKELAEESWVDFGTGEIKSPQNSANGERAAL